MHDSVLLTGLPSLDDKHKLFVKKKKSGKNGVSSLPQTDFKG